MENMKVGDVKGAFVLDAALSGDPVIKATVVSMTIVGGLTLIIVLIGFHVFTTRTIIRPLSTTINQINGTSEQTSAASNQIATASQSLAEGASEQAASLEETSASLEEMTSMVRRTADSARAAKQLTSETRSAANSGAQSNQKLNGSLELIRSASEDMRLAVGGIKASSDNVARIIKTIDEIAFQTNILALNAAVEAARAGEAGQGFAVVADEVRNLAQRSARAAKETAELIDASVRQSEQGVIVNERMFETIKTVAAAAGDVAKALKEIESRVAEVDSQVGQIASASSEQSTGILQINTAVTELDKVTQSNAANAEESASVCEELHAQALSLKEAIHNLKHLVDGTVSHSPGSVAERNSHGPEAPRGAGADPSDRSFFRSLEQKNTSSLTSAIHHGKGGTQKKSAAGNSANSGDAVSF
jgi:methyl-accepting chemotaxis protein